jgi:neutral trehalase
VKIGAYDPGAWTGLVLSDQPGRGCALRWAVERDGERADGADLLFLVHDVGPHDPDGGYARVEFDTSLPFGKGDDTPLVKKPGRTAGLTVEWSRTESGAVLRARVAFRGVLELRGYFPWDWTGRWTAEATGMAATTADGGLRCRVRADRAGSAAVTERGEAVLRFAVAPGDQVHVTAAVGGDAPPAYAAAIAGTLSDGADAYAARRVATEGLWEGLPASITNNLHWMVCLQPETGRLYTPAGRRWIFPAPGGGRDHWTIFEWDSFFNALELGVESEALAVSTLEAVLATQFDNGNIPNWRGRFWGPMDRSQPPVGALCVLKHYLRFGNRAVLEHAFPYLERWSAWWTADKRGKPRRDGNANGLLEWGSDLDLVRPSPASWENGTTGLQRAAWESGEDDLPNWDDGGWNDATETMELDAVDLNSFLALDHACLATIAERLGLPDRAAFHGERAAAVRRAMNDLLWDEQRGLYLDRHWDGRRSATLAAANFLPLIAGVPTPAQAERMLRTLLDPARFWGPYVVPTISRDDPAFKDQQYWRGTIWPPTNYLLYQGLRRYGFDQAAAELAQRSVDLFLTTWREYRLCRENYDSRTGAGGGQRYQSWGPLFALIGIEEFLDVTPWDGLRLGSAAAPGRTALRRLHAQGHEWTVTLAPDLMRVEMDGALLFESDRPIVARQVEVTSGELRAEVTATSETTLRTLAGSHTVAAGRQRVILPLGGG